jgi:tetratricopeptide (TPR) repeat protein
MSHPNKFRPAKKFFCVSLLICLSALGYTSPTYAQDNIPELRAKAQKLLDELRYTEAVPVLEKLVAAEPNDPAHHYFLASALLGVVANTPNEAMKKEVRIRARAEFVKAKYLGSKEANLDGMIAGLAPDGSGPGAFTSHAEAEKAMAEGEAFFSRGDVDGALKAYQKALSLDPSLYHAALFSGDVYMQKGDFTQAEVWYQRAITIDPNKETAYRYSATPLMKQEKYDEALKRYIEAWITEPYNRLATSGLVQWGQVTKRPLGHPKIDIPTNVQFDEKGNAKIDLDASALLGGKDDGSFAWISYGATRTQWHKEKFKQTFPGETTYRHSLAEEADALRSVITMATADKKTKLNPSLETLKKLNDQGLLEAYILLAIPDQGIAQDHASYLKNNRDKLRRYATDWVAKGGGE